MQALQILTFILWGFTVALAQNQECTKNAVNFDRTNKYDLKDSYKHEEIAKLSCVTGYVGYVKIQCNDGKWEKVGEKDCKKKPCGHPGTINNGDFTFVKDSEFVYGATVKYSCSTGYLMVSRSPFRNCRETGWDNNLPICEVVKCPPLTNLQGVNAIGNIEQPSYNEVVRFECPQTQMLSKRVDLVCTENGTWSDSVPQCIEIKCEKPKIENGEVTSFNAEYRDNDVLNYRCHKNYIRRPGTIKCSKHGWTMKPECEEVVCRIDPSPSGVKDTEPIGQNIFGVGESVTIHCLDRNWIGLTKKNFKKVLCKETGEWESEIRCDKILCGKPTIQNGNVEWTIRDSHEPGKTLTYTCNSGFEPKGIQSITCNLKGNWDISQPCERENTEVCDPPPYTENAVIISKDKRKATYQCRHNFKMMGNPEIFCTNLQWEDPPTCNTSCHLPPYTENAVITSHINFQSATYKCRDQFMMIGRPTITCVNYEWGNPPECVYVLERP